jgi:hypothetical protein
MNIVGPAASTAGPKAIRHRPGIVRPNFSLQPSAFNLFFSVSVFAHGWNFEKRNLSSPPFLRGITSYYAIKKTRQAKYMIINTNNSSQLLTPPKADLPSDTQKAFFAFRTAPR